MKKFAWYVFVFFAVVIGLYPFGYLLFDMSQGLIGTKSDELLSSFLWKPLFYAHIYFGGLALLTGWSQFNRKFRDKYLQWHKRLGKIYVTSVLISGLAGFCLSFNATGGVSTGLGFGTLAVFWLSTTLTSFLLIRKKKTEEHQQWMIRSYSLCFAAVTLRLWMPFFQAGLEFSFIKAYYIVAWLCWIPNVLVAELIIKRVNAKKARNFSPQL